MDVSEFRGVSSEFKLKGIGGEFPSIVERAKTLRSVPPSEFLNRSSSIAASRRQLSAGGQKVDRVTQAGKGRCAHAGPSNLAVDPSVMGRSPPEPVGSNRGLGESYPR